MRAMKGWAEATGRYVIDRREPLVNCALILLLAYLVADLTWRWLPPTEAVSQHGDARALAQTRAAAGDRSTLAADIAGWHLFGHAQAPRQLPVTVVKAPETTLDLRLAGVFHSSSSATPPLALIAAGKGVEQRYREGDLLAKDIRIERIDRDQVLLSRQGELEMLILPRESNRAAGTQPDSSSGVRAGDRVASRAAASDQAMTVQAGAVARELRAKSKNQPDSLQDIAYADPHVQDGRFVGLRLKPGRNRELLGQLGLRNGDVLTELNGSKLTDPAQGASLLQQLLTADQINAKVIRNGVEMPFTFVLNQ